MFRLTFFRGSKTLVRGQLRGLHSSTHLLGAQPYKMPAVSPTMDRGNIVEWKADVGNEVSAGDVLLEVESDKAQVDVESPDDVKLAKIIVGNGTKDVPVGKIIAWLADVDDDLSTLKIPDTTPEVEAQSNNEPKSSNESKPNDEPKPNNEPKPKEENPPKAAPKKRGGSESNSNVLSDASPDQMLLPSVQALLAANDISKEDAIKNIKASGNNGRLLKGDVLAYLGKISEDSVVKVAEYVKSGEKLDLSHIELGQIASSSETHKPEPPKVVKPEPVVIKDQVTIQLPAGVSLEGYKKSLRAFVETAFHAAHGRPLSDPHSQYYDEIFESLLVPAPKKARFSVSYDLVSGSSVAERNAILDFLADDKTTKETPETYVFKFEVKVSDEFIDAKTRAQNFADSLKELKIN